MSMRTYGIIVCIFAIACAIACAYACSLYPNPTGRDELAKVIIVALFGGAGGGAVVSYLVEFIHKFRSIGKKEKGKKAR